jgi:hypothetical protein
LPPIEVALTPVIGSPGAVTCWADAAEAVARARKPTSAAIVIDAVNRLENISNLPIWLAFPSCE